MQLYIYSLIRTHNPDIRSSCFGPRASVLVLRSSCFGPRASVLVLRSSCFVSHRFCPTYMEGSVFRNEWGIEVLPYRGFSASCNVWKGYLLKPYIKSFPTYQPKYLWVFILGFAEKFFFSASCHFWKWVYETMFHKFSNLSTKIFMGFYFQSCRERV
jgi:hypothetical protein